MSQNNVIPRSLQTPSMRVQQSNTFNRGQQSNTSNEGQQWPEIKHLQYRLPLQSPEVLAFTLILTIWLELWPQLPLSLECINPSFYLIQPPGRCAIRMKQPKAASLTRVMIVTLTPWQELVPQLPLQTQRLRPSLQPHAAALTLCHPRAAPGGRRWRRRTPAWVHAPRAPGTLPQASTVGSISAQMSCHHDGLDPQNTSQSLCVPLQKPAHSEAHFKKKCLQMCLNAWVEYKEFQLMHTQANSQSDPDLQIT
eukprot:1161263-Pelagomonas_calceolata.AAC.19